MVVASNKTNIVGRGATNPFLRGEAAGQYIRFPIIICRILLKSSVTSGHMKIHVLPYTYERHRSTLHVNIIIQMVIHVSEYFFVYCLLVVNEHLSQVSSYCLCFQMTEITLQ